MTASATPPEGKEEKEARSPGYHRSPHAAAALDAGHASSPMYYGSPGYSYHLHYGSANDVDHDVGGYSDKNVDYTNGYSSPRDSYAEEYWPEGDCGYGGGGGYGGSGLGGFTSSDLELPIVLAALALGGLATFFLRQAITTKIGGGRGRRRRWADSDISPPAPVDSVEKFFRSGKEKTCCICRRLKLCFTGHFKARPQILLLLS
jgi:hypothetical protein